MYSILGKMELFRTVAKREGIPIIIQCQKAATISYLRAAFNFSARLMTSIPFSLQ